MFGWAKDVGRAVDKCLFSSSTALIKSAHMLAPPPGSEIWYARPDTLHTTSNSLAFFCLIFYKEKENRKKDGLITLNNMSATTRNTHHVALDGPVGGPGDLSLVLHGVRIHIEQPGMVRQNQLTLLRKQTLER